MLYGLLLFCDSKHVLIPEAGVKHASQFVGDLSTEEASGGRRAVQSRSESTEWDIRESRSPPGQQQSSQKPHPPASLPLPTRSLHARRRHHPSVLQPDCFNDRQQGYTVVTIDAPDDIDVVEYPDGFVVYINETVWDTTNATQLAATAYLAIET
jgi:hypothetical protein